MSTKENKQEATKKPIIATSSNYLATKDKVKNVVNEIEGGLGNIIIGELQSKETDRLIGKIKTIGLEAHVVIGEVAKKFYAIKEGDIIQHVAVDEDSLATSEVKAFSAERAKLRPRVQEANNKLVNAYDEAFSANTEASWDLVDKMVKETKKVIEDVNKHLKS